MSHAPRELLEAWHDERREKHHAFNVGIDTSICYVTTKQLAGWSGEATSTIRAKVCAGTIAAVRRRKGNDGILIHPDEAKRYLISRTH